MPLRPLHERSVPRTAAEALDPSTSAVLLWDLQYGLGGHALELAQLRERWAQLRDAALETGALVVRSRHVSAPLEHLDDVELWRLMRKQGVDHPTKLKPFMRPGSHDVEFLEGFEPGPDEVVIEKTTPSLFVNTPADARLRSAGIRTLVLAGVATDIGIEFTARHAMALGYLPVTVSDAVGAYTVDAQARGLSCLGAFTFVASTDEVTEAWRDRDLSVRQTLV